MMQGSSSVPSSQPEALVSGTELLPTARLEGQALVASVRGEIDLHNSPELRGALMEMVAKHNPNRVVLNLALVPYMDSSAIAVLVELLQKLHKVGGKIALTNLQPRVKGLLEIARLHTIFIIAKDETAALTK